jgi:hypothetical protein
MAGKIGSRSHHLLESVSGDESNTEGQQNEMLDLSQ